MNDINVFMYVYLTWVINLFDAHIVIICIYKLEYDVYSLSVAIYMWNKLLNINKKGRVLVF